MRYEKVGHAQLLAASRIARAKQSKTLRIVGIIAAGRLIEKFAIEELRAVDEVKLHSVRFAAVHYRDKTVVVEKGNSEARESRPGGP